MVSLVANLQSYEYTFTLNDNVLKHTNYPNMVSILLATKAVGTISFVDVYLRLRSW